MAGALTKAEPGKYGCVFCSQVRRVKLPHGRPFPVLTFAWVELQRKTNSWIEISVCMDYCVGCGWPLMREKQWQTESEGDWQREIKTYNEWKAKKEKVRGGCIPSSLPFVETNTTYVDISTSKLINMHQTELLDHRWPLYCYVLPFNLPFMSYMLNTL